VATFRFRLVLPSIQETEIVNDTPHLLAIIESKMAQVRTQLEHNRPIKARDLLAEVETYAEDLRFYLKA